MTVLQTVGNEIESEFYGDTNIPGTYIHARNLQKLVRSVCYEKKKTTWLSNVLASKPAYLLM